MWIQIEGRRGGRKNCNRHIFYSGKKSVFKRGKNVFLMFTFCKKNQDGWTENNLILYLAAVGLSLFPVVLEPKGLPVK